jgi:type 1 glutamine amidotransferase
LIANRARLLAAAVFISACAHPVPPAAFPPPRPLRVLILDGQNNHDWRRTTASLRGTLDAAHRFTVEVSTTPEAKAAPEAWDAWRPRFADFDVVVSNYNGESWPLRVQHDFTSFVESGGGAVMVHAANNPFPDWPEFNRMIGLGWRKPDYGDRITIDDASGALVRTPKGAGPTSGHGPAHVFAIKVRQPEHPIMKGLPLVWMHGKDQLSHGQRGPGENMTVLDSAFSAKDHGGTGEHEPVTWTIPYGKGRVVTTMLGHQWRDQEDESALDCIGFRTVFARSVEWAATGVVTIPVPPDFPTATELSLRKR